MQEKQIPFNGITLTPYSDISPDGQLSDSQNMELYNGALRPITVNGKKYSGFDGYNLIYIHTTADYQHYIFTDSSNQIVYSKDLKTVVETDINLKVKKIGSIGNTLIILSDNGGNYYETNYVLYKEGEYKLLGTDIPYIDFSAMLVGQFKVIQGPTVNVTTETVSETGNNEVIFDAYAIEQRQQAHQEIITAELKANKQYTLQNVSTKNTSWWKTEVYLIRTTDRGDTSVYYGWFSNRDLYYITPKEDFTKIKLVQYWTENSGITYLSVRYTLIALGDTVNTTFRFINDETHINNIISKVNDIVTAEKKENKYVYPFFLRYALELYDGTIVNPSGPILLIPNTTEYAPKIYGKYNTGGYEEKMYSTIYFYNSCQLNCLLLSNVDELKEWGDIVKSVNFYVSDQVLPYKTDSINRIEATDKEGNHKAFTIASSFYDGKDIQFGKVSLYSLFNNLYNSSSNYIFETEILLPLKNQDDIYEFYTTCDQFYKISSININKLTQNIFNPFMGKSVLPTLQSKDKLPNEDFRYGKIKPRDFFIYNKRLSIYDLEKTFSKPANPTLLNGYTLTDIWQEVNITVRIYIETSKGTQIVQNRFKNFYNQGHHFNTDQIIWYYYPNNDARKCEIIYHIRDLNSKIEIYKVGILNLTQHKSLNGSYNFEDWGSFSDFIEITAEEYYKDYYNDISSSEIFENEIKLSEVNNPFLFPLEGTNIVGTGTILALSSIVKPLSQGQYGQFPIMAFCSDGNYALQINEEGLIVAAPPMQRDVCINPNSITQIDGAVIYVAERGVMMADGNDIQCISSQLTGVTDTFTDEKNGVTIRPMDLFRKCNTIFDYANQRLIFFDPTNELQYALTYSLSSGTWNNITVLDFIKAINIYPYSYIQDKNGNIILIDQSYDFLPTQQPIEGKIITRPLKLDTLQFKRLTAFALQGIFKDKQEISLYGSNDATTWRFLGKTQRAAVNNITGRTYKYFRFVIRTSLTPEENISGLRLQYDIRREKRLR